ncbi:MAG: tryptophan synthase subunit alpha [Eubacteriaceae bacterium]|nr:tryptophan synthase subunit alpha [Eubacteriaceae bacterium]
MTRITKAFEGNKALITFVTGGDPDIETTELLVLEMEKAGADLIEIGIPFSDPIAEGIVIQQADERALAAGCTTDKLFDMVARLRQKTEIPLVFMTYINPIFTYGKERFMAKCKECGIDGVIVPDMPFEEKGELQEFCDNHNICLISMIAPTSGDRAAKIANQAEGFLYCVSSLGVTGVRSDINMDIAGLIEGVKKVSGIPCAIGFGISSPEQAKKMASISDGVIVGSAIVRLVAQYGKESPAPVSEFVKGLKSGISTVSE